MSAAASPHAAIVTGAASGFGAVAARALRRAGHRVLVTDIDGDAARRLASELDPAGATAFAADLDVRRPEDFEHVRDEAIGRWGSVEILVNNAAMTVARPLLEIELAEFNAIMATNAGGVFAGSQILGRHFKERGYGRIVNLASLAGQNGGTATGAHYAASKGAILTLTKVFARDLAPFGVTVNAIAPGPMDTPLVHALVPPEKMPGMLANIPVGRLIDPDFAAEMIVLLASPAAASVTGACWDVNGGLFMR
ncbi:MAG: 3-oxoacyl-ACP reductase [Rhizobiales bacterium 65-9]|nr:SDR family oxidoreductase [Hyphomicrobiales bacterium]OJY35560.1 MAG: 3-oxoacyl-ACP reductase [Rhizobiales bacterium 65-9]